MISIFDLCLGTSGTKEIKDNFHQHRSPGRNFWQEATRNVVFSENHIKDNTVTNLSRSSSNKKSGVTLMKVLIAQEISKGMETWKKPPTVVARLMGLDALPAQPSPTISQRVNAECMTYRSCSAGRTVWTPLEQEHIHYERTMLNRDQHFHSHVDNLVYKDVYVVSPKVSKNKVFNEESYSGEGCNECSIDKRMSLVRQKFMEAKRLTSNQALESQSNPIPGQYRRITVLKPTKACDEGSEQMSEDRLLKEAANDCGMNRLNGSAKIILQKQECFSHKTKIVILRPSPGKFGDTKPIKLCSTFYPKHHERKSSFDELGSDRSIRSKDVAKETVQCMQESFSGHARNETSISSVLSYGYFGDESSFNRSESDYIEEECDTEVVTPTSCLSSDYMGRLNSPSEFLFRHALFLPKSSVIIEAKKRLSERWTMGTSSQMNQEQTQELRNGNTLGEMLSFRETNKEGRDELRAPSSSGSFGDEQEPYETSSYLFSKREEMEKEVKNCPSVQRVKYVYVSSSKHGNALMDTRDPGCQVSWLDKPKKEKSTVKGKISNFFSRNKKTIVKQHSSIHLTGPGDNIQLGKIENHEGPPYTFEKLLMMDSSQISERDSNRQMTSSLEQYYPCGYKEHTSSLSVLEGPYRNISMKYSDTASVGCQRTISRSPPIESVARSLWDRNKCLGRTSLNSPKLMHSCVSADVEKEERLLFVQSLLSSAGLSTETSDTLFARWHSVDTPLNPALLDKLLMSRDDTWYREIRSNLKLLFDCVNDALLDVNLKRVLLPIDGLVTSSKISAPTSVTEDVLRRIDDWFCTDKLFMLSYASKMFEVDMVVRKEVSRNRWSEMMGSETVAVGVLIEDQILDGLVGEALDDFMPGLLQ